MSIMSADNAQECFEAGLPNGLSFHYIENGIITYWKSNDLNFSCAFECDMPLPDLLKFIGFLNSHMKYVFSELVTKILQHEVKQDE